VQLAVDVGVHLVDVATGVAGQRLLQEPPTPADLGRASVEIGQRAAHNGSIEG